jgi:hypothetical protein
VVAVENSNVTLKPTDEPAVAGIVAGTVNVSGEARSAESVALDFTTSVTWSETAGHVTLASV